MRRQFCPSPIPCCIATSPGKTADGLIVGVVGDGRCRVEKDDDSEHLDAETSLPPVPSLGVVTVWSLRLAVGSRSGADQDESGAEGRGVPDGVVCSQPDPLRHRAVLLLRLGKLLLGTERLVALSRHCQPLMFSQVPSRHAPGPVGWCGRRLREKTGGTRRLH